MFVEVEPLIENTACELRKTDGNDVSYRIRPKKGYKLHEITLDEKVIDEETTRETGEIKKGYTKSYITAGIGYDFVKNEREIYSVKDE